MTVRYIHKAPMLAPFSFYLDTNGDGTGTKSAVGDYSDATGVGLTEFYIQPPANRVFEIQRLTIFIEDSLINADDYGAINTGLTNGIRVRVTNDNGIVEDLTDGVPVQTSAGWGRVCNDAKVLEWGAGNEFMVGQWVFNHGSPIVLRGNNENSVAPDNERLTVILHDDLRELVAHYFVAQGHVQ